MQSLLIPLASGESSFGVSAFETSGDDLKSHPDIRFLLSYDTVDDVAPEKSLPIPFFFPNADTLSP